MARSKQPMIRNRQQMAQVLDERMAATHQQLASQGADTHHSLVKSYIIEAHQGRSKSRKHTPSAIIARSVVGIGYEVKQYSTDDPDLTVLYAQRRSKRSELLIDH